MSDKPEKTEPPVKSRERPPKGRSGYRGTDETIEKWANSSGLQKPT